MEKAVTKQAINVAIDAPTPAYLGINQKFNTILTMAPKAVL